MTSIIHFVRSLHTYTLIVRMSDSPLKHKHIQERLICDNNNVMKFQIFAEAECQPNASENITATKVGRPRLSF